MLIISPSFTKEHENITFCSPHVRESGKFLNCVCNTAVFSVVTQLRTLRDDTKNGCVSDTIRNFCLWNPQSWALQSGMQLKESAIPLTTRNPNASSNTEILGAERIQLLSQIPSHEAILCCLDQSVYQHNRQSTTEEEMTSFIDSIPIIFCSVSVQLYNYSWIHDKVRTKHLLESISRVSVECFNCHEIK